MARLGRQNCAKVAPGRATPTLVQWTDYLGERLAGTAWPGWATRARRTRAAKATPVLGFSLTPQANGSSGNGEPTS